MNTTLSINRQLPLAQKYEDQIQREEMCAREKILAEACMAKSTRKSQSMARVQRVTDPKSVSADVVIHVSTRMEANPGPGAWAASSVNKDGLTKESDYYPAITGPQLELEAIIAVLIVIENTSGTLAINTSAKWIAEYLNNGQVQRWQDNGWRKANGDPVANAESWKELFRLYKERDVEIAWVKPGTTPGMKQCGALAKRAFTAKKSLS
jgi:ribonuclease HI